MKPLLKTKKTSKSFENRLILLPKAEQTAFKSFDNRLNRFWVQIRKGGRAVGKPKEELNEMTVAQWSEHLNTIKRHSIENEAEYASAWTQGRTVFAIQGEWYVRPLRYRSIPLTKMSEGELTELYETPGTPFLFVHAVT